MSVEKLLPEKEVKTLVEKTGFAVQRIKRDNSCYEVKGKRKDDKSVEIYVNPVDASIVKEEVKQGIPPAGAQSRYQGLFSDVWCGGRFLIFWVFPAGVAAALDSRF